MRTRALTLSIAKTTRTDLVCIACGGFRTDFAILVGDGEASANAGVHKGECLDAVRRRRAQRAEDTTGG